MQNQFLINGRHDGLTPLDRGFAYGDGVFRTLPVYRGHPHCWERHYHRLSDDCNALGIVCPPAELLLGDITRLCGDDEDAAFKIIVTRGNGMRGYAVPPLAQPNRVLLKSGLPIWPESNFSYGVSLHLCQLALSSQPRLAGIKHLNRLENVLARMEWTDANIADGLLLDIAGNVIECTMSNVFIRQNDILLTPDLTQCGVAGVTRQRIVELATTLGFEVRVCSFKLDSLLSADEVVLCNSLFGAWQVRELAGKTWPAGELASRLRTLLKEDHAPTA
ncbi:MAG TPA: aminodeoxychorismate lyase [Methylophilaceae bacterium]|nr:aminodeoxychorismate lyase [Methylophilaceae bacterium]HQR61149.1 aminodeoxychorismate lyase [Methylophilaceae bacterium]